MVVRVNSEIKGDLFDIQRYSINDGPGIRTTIFLKGCPLSCLWCSNPESQRSYPQLIYFDQLCTRCYRCVEACPTGATTISEDGSITIGRDKCIACGSCVEMCLAEARVISGRQMTIDEVMEIVKKDSLFYRNSGGGVTASGGEPLAQPEFLLELFKRCHESGIDTVLDTCGYVQWEVLEEILNYTDLVLFDIKHMDTERHEQLTKVSNQLILENAKRIADHGTPEIIRMPLVPGYNDSRENIEALARFMVDSKIFRLDLVPYHQMGESKYNRLDLVYKLNDVKPYKEEEVEAIKKIFQSYGLKVEIV